jgi:recombinational DNA repair ATPase RecF
VAEDNGGWMKMQIERLELRNFEGYKRAEINFERGLNVITGRNSTGKTTLLDAEYLLQELLSAHMLRDVDSHMPKLA